MIFGTVRRLQAEHMKGKKFICAALTFLITASLCGCGGAQDGRQIYKIGVLVSNTKNEAMMRYAEELASRFDEMNTNEKCYELTVLSSDADSSKQIMQTKTFAYQQYDALIVSLTDENNAWNIIENSVAKFEVQESDVEGDLSEEPTGNASADTLKENGSDEESSTKENSAADDSGDSEGGTQPKEEEDVAAEPDPRSDGVDVPNLESRSIPVVFTFTEPVIKQEEGEKEGTTTQTEGEEAGNEEEKKEEKINLDNWCSITTKQEDAGVLLGKATENLPQSGDINSDETFNYIVAANSKKDNIYKKYTETLTEYFKEKGIEANCLGEVFSEAKGASFEKSLRNVVDANWEKTDAVFCLDERSAETLYNLTNAAHEASGGQDEETESENKPELRYYDIGTDFYVVGMTSVEGGKKLISENKLSAAVSFDVSEVAKAAAEAATNYLDGVDNLKTQSIEVYAEVVKGEDE